MRQEAGFKVAIACQNLKPVKSLLCMKGWGMFFLGRGKGGI